MTIKNTSKLILANDMASRAKGLESGSRGLALIGFAEALRTPSILSYRDSDGKARVFGLRDYPFPVMKPDGTRDGKAKSSQLTTILVTMLGVPDNAQAVADAAASKALVNATLGAAIYYNAKAFTFGCDARGNLTGVPFEVAFDCVTKEGKPTPEFLRVEALVKAAKPKAKGDALIGMVRGFKLTCDGSRHPILGKLPTSAQVVARLKAAAVDTGLIPAPDKRDVSRDDSDDGQSLMAAMKLIGETFAAWNMAEGESKVAWSEELDALARQTYAPLAYYIEHNPKG
jgi:hypothetical protein